MAYLVPNLGGVGHVEDGQPVRGWQIQFRKDICWSIRMENAILLQEIEIFFE